MAEVIPVRRLCGPGNCTEGRGFCKTEGICEQFSGLDDCELRMCNDNKYMQLAI